MTTLLYYNMVLRAEIISTHILTKRMTELVVDHIDGNVFQLTSSRRGWPEEFNEKYDNIIFQLTSSRRGWRNSLYIKRWCFQFQLTSSRRGWPPKAKLSWNLISISTHILTKRMTLYFKTLKVWYINFNSHPHEEDDDNILSYDTDMLFQLTSSRRGWRGKKHTVDKIQVFQLTSSRRGWLMTTLQLSLMLHFNSHPHEEDDRSRNNTICT